MFRFVVLAVLVVVASAGNLGYFRGIGSSPIVGGTEASIQDAPWQVALMVDHSFICGGSIITTTAILSAAQCFVEAQTPERWMVRVGSAQRASGGTTHKVSKVSAHPQYDDDTSDYDIAVLTLTEAIVIDNLNTKLIPLPALNQDVPAGSDALVTGWGYTSEDGDFTDTLRKVTLPVVNQTACASANTPYNITDRMICGGLLETGGLDACIGDGGGPFVVNGFVIGIVSWGLGCGEPKLPGVYTRVPALVDWVQDQL